MILDVVLLERAGGFGNLQCITKEKENISARKNPSWRRKAHDSLVV